MVHDSTINGIVNMQNFFPMINDVSPIEKNWTLFAFTSLIVCEGSLDQVVSSINNSLTSTTCHAEDSRGVVLTVRQLFHMGHTISIKGFSYH